MKSRTDLVAEEKRIHTDKIQGTATEQIQFGEVSFERVKIETQGAAAILKRPVGTYITIQFDRSCDCRKDLTHAVVRALTELLPENCYRILAVGLGNRDITPDAIGPMICDRLLATRHLERYYSGKDLRFRPVSVLVPGVLGKTGIEAVDTVRGTTARIRPDAVLVIDALAARDPARICHTVQLCDTGISPGSGVQNARREFSRSTLGIPVVAVGVPTVVDVGTLLAELCNTTVPESVRHMMITPQDIDLAIRQVTDLLSEAINLYLQPNLDEKTLSQLV